MWWSVTKKVTSVALGVEHKCSVKEEAAGAACPCDPCVRLEGGVQVVSWECVPCTLSETGCDIRDRTVRACENPRNGGR